MEFGLSKIGLGALEEKFGDTMATVIENIVDPNTAITAKREITIKITFKPSLEERSICSMSSSVVAKLAPTKTLLSQIRVGIDETSKEVDAIEYVPQQGELFEPKPAKAKIQAIG